MFELFQFTLWDTTCGKDPLSAGKALNILTILVDNWLYIYVTT